MKNKVNQTYLLIIFYYLILVDKSMMLKKVCLLAVGLAVCLPGSIYASEAQVLENQSISQQRRKVSGTITDGYESVIGASVLVKGTTTGTISDLDGNFAIEVNDGQTLVISFTGYETQEITVNGQTSLTITLKEDTQTLDEVVVTALGIKREAKKLGYAVSTVDANELTKTGTPNFATSLYGKAAGVRIQSAPGGGSSAVSINVRGVSSISGTNQPLLVVDGVPVRNGEANNDGYWTDQRIRGNGLVDINPEDIESLSILKGASASALYGSEAANGVVLITTKSGSGKKGVSVDFNVSFGIDKAAYLPEYQTTYGPGAPHELRSGDWIAGNGWRTVNHNGREYTRPQYETNYQFGPRFDGREVLYWDGTTRNYSPYANGNGWEKLFRTGNNGTYNVAITAGGDKSTTRFSYTYYDQQNLQRGSSINRHNFNLSGMLQPHSRVRLDYNLNYMRKGDINRPYRFSRLTNNFTGMFSNFDDLDRLWDKTVTSLGYLNVFENDETLTPDESLLYRIGGRDLLAEYYWNIKKKRYEEETNRVLGNLTATVDIYDGLSFRAKVGTDFTSEKRESMNSTEKPLSIGNSGYYGLTNERYEIYYGDVMLQYAKDFNETWGVSASAGYTIREEKQYWTTTGTDKGLSVENWFHINASVNSEKEAKMRKMSLLRQAFFGIAGISFKNYLFLEGTVRSERSSTLLPRINTYTYPSVNGSILISEMLGENRPTWLDYLKLRGSYGIVGNSPEVYKAFFGYEQSTINSILYNKFSEDLANNNLRPEEKHEMEFGLEGKFLNNRLGFEATYYRNVIKDQILQTSTPWSSGAKSLWENVGELQNSGWEFAVYGTPVQTRDFKWDLRANISFNKNKVNKLLSGQDELLHSNLDNGAIRFVSRVGESTGDLMAYVPKEVNGQPVVGSNGLYTVDNTVYKKVGNVTPDAVGGISTSFSWKNFYLDASIDFSIGGDIMHTPYQYMMSRGGIKESLKYRGTENGGLTYYYENEGDFNSKKIAASSAPNGHTLYDDGMILSGVKEDGTPNDIVISAGTYYPNMYGWGTSSVRSYSQSVFDNSYVKLRELTIGYTLPAHITSKFGCKSLTLSLYGRNLFFIYKNLPGFDAESVDGTSWLSKYQIGGSSASARTFGFSIRSSF